jgi:hypothetical protein
MLAGLVAPKLSVGRFWVPAGAEVMEAESVTLPVKPPEGLMVMMDALPASAPGAMETAVPLTVKEDGTGVLTVTENLLDALEKIAELCASGV